MRNDYIGRRLAVGCSVTSRGVELPLCLNVVRHSPEGFDWGSAGYGAAQLAIAILCQHRRRQWAEAYHQQFALDVIAALPRDEWLMTWGYVEGWCCRQEELWALRADGKDGAA